LGAYARVALVLLTLSASFGLAGCAALDDVKVSIFEWFDTVNFTGEGEELLGYAPEARLIPPAEIPRPAAKTPRKKIKAATRKLPQPQTVVLPPKKPPIAEFPETAMPGETEGQSARPPSMRPRCAGVGRPSAARLQGSHEQRDRRSRQQHDPGGPEGKTSTIHRAPPDGVQRFMWSTFRPVREWGRRALVSSARR